MNTKRRRKGTVAVLLCFLILPLIGLLALSVDYGFLLYIRTDLQRVNDQAAIAAVRDLIPDENGQQDLAKVRQTVRDYVEQNLGKSFTVKDSDIEIGRFNPSTIYSNVELLDNGIFDAVRVSLRRDDLANQSVALYFARLLNIDFVNVSTQSTAVLQRTKYLPPGARVLPITMDELAWNNFDIGDLTSIYGDGSLIDRYGQRIPGNWGTLDIGSTTNSTNDLGEQIVNGLSQDDLNTLHREGRIPQSTHIDSAQDPLVLNGDTGFSAGMKAPIREVHGQVRYMPIYNKTTGKGGSLEFDIVAWAAVEVYDSAWNGNNNSQVTVRKVYTYDNILRPNPDLSDPTGTIEGAFTAPVLVQ